MTNISKTRKFPNHYYTIYKLKKSGIGIYHNVWFEGELDDIRFDAVTNESIPFYDSLWTVKTVDSDTANRLYSRKYNPVSVRIMAPTGAKFKFTENKERLYTMKADIHSIDDSSFGVWWNDSNNNTFESLLKTRQSIMDYVDTQKKLNGDSFLQRCIELGADEETIDYN